MNTIKYNMSRADFIHRHSKFPPCARNIFLLGFALGAILGALVFVLLSTFNHQPSTF